MNLDDLITRLIEVRAEYPHLATTEVMADMDRLLHITDVAVVRDKDGWPIRVDIE